MSTSSKKAPVGLEAGDKFETPFGDIEILEADGDDYKINDPRTSETTWLEHDDLLAIMQATVYDFNRE